MNRILKLLALVTVCLVLPTFANAQELAGASSVRRYPSLKSEFLDRIANATTDENMLDVYRQTVTRGRHSGRPVVERMFKGFDPKEFPLNPKTPGLDKAVLKTASDNKYVAKGAMRTIRYAMELQATGKYEVTGIDRPRQNALGRTDADIEFIHKDTGRRGRIEVKDMTPESQRANLKKIKSQIDKMALDRKLKGEIQIWINRKEVIPEIVDYARSKGIRVEGNVKTGTSASSRGRISLSEIADELDTELRAGTLQKAKLSPQTNRLGVQKFFRSSATSSPFQRARFCLARASSTKVAAASKRASQKILRKMLRAGRKVLVIVGVFGTVVEGIAVADTVRRYAQGYMTTREFYRQMGTDGGGIAGAVLGAGAGAAAGSFFGPPGVAVGGIVGGVLGAFGGAMAGDMAGNAIADRLLKPNNEELRRAFRQGLELRYGSLGGGG